MVTTTLSPRTAQRVRDAERREAAYAELPDDARGLLEALTTSQRTAWAAEADQLALVCAWVDANPVDPALGYGPGARELHGDREVHLAGEGTPAVSEFAVVEVAAHLGLSIDAGSRLVADALELRHRLPNVWTRIQSLELPAWRGRRIAAATTDLTREAAEFVDLHVAPVAHAVGLQRLDQLITRAKVAYMPDAAAEDVRKAADRRHVTIDLRRVGADGTCRITGRIDVPDALELQQAITARAAERAIEGDDEDLDARRASAVGDLARLYLGEQGHHDRRVTKRDATLVVHLHPERIDADIVDLDGNLGIAHVNDLVRWLDGANVTIKPVIDLAHLIETNTYRPTSRIADIVRTRDTHCVFPWCNRPAATCDLDHIDAFDDTGPPGQTATTRLASLCRRHHRAKTHGRWRYVNTDPGVYTVAGPHDQQWITTALLTIPDW